MSRLSTPLRPEVPCNQRFAQNQSDRLAHGRILARMKHRPKPRTITKGDLKRFMAFAVLFVCRLAGFVFSVGHPRGRRRLRRYIRRGERLVAHLLFLAAVSELGARRRPNIRIRFAPRGFRVSCGAPHLLVKSARIRLPGGSIRARVLRLVDALANPARHVAHFKRLLRKGLRIAALTPVAPPAQALSAACHAAAVELTDSS